MPANNGVLKGIVSQETRLDTGVVLHHALVWIVHVIKNPDAEVSGFVVVKLVYANAILNKHSDISAAAWNKLDPQTIPLQPLLPCKGSMLTRSAVSLLSLHTYSISPYANVCHSRTCKIECCVSARVSQNKTNAMNQYQNTTKPTNQRKKMKAGPKLDQATSGGEGGMARVGRFSNVDTDLGVGTAGKGVGNAGKGVGNAGKGVENAGKGVGNAVQGVGNAGKGVDRKSVV